jgi:hypothetical protein
MHPQRKTCNRKREREMSRLDMKLSRLDMTTSFSPVANAALLPPLKRELNQI